MNSPIAEAAWATSRVNSNQGPLEVASASAFYPQHMIASLTKSCNQGRPFDRRDHVFPGQSIHEYMFFVTESAGTPGIRLAQSKLMGKKVFLALNHLDPEPRLAENNPFRDTRMGSSCEKAFSLQKHKPWYHRTEPATETPRTPLSSGF